MLKSKIMKKEPSNVEAGPKEGLKTAMGKWGTHI